MDKKILVLVLILFCNHSSIFSQSKDVQWENLFDGKTLNGWKQINGKAKFFIENGMIVGESVPNSPNSFLFTEKSFGNFILELDFKVDEGLNSGIQIRSKSILEYQNGRVHGYQVEIDPSQNPYSGYPPNFKDNGQIVPPNAEPRRWTGGIYDEGRRGWLFDLTHNEKARLAFKPNQWNHIRIEAIGDVIKTWINDVLAANLVDGMTPNGFIGLQVHATEEHKPMRVYFKNIRIKDLGFNNSPEENYNFLLGDWYSNNLCAQLYVKDENYFINILKTLEDNLNPIAVLKCFYNSKDSLLFEGNGWKGKIFNSRLQLISSNEKYELRHIVRYSSTLNAPPPKNAIVLFDGTNLDSWGKQKAKDWLTVEGAATNWKLIPGGKIEAIPGNGSIITKKNFKDFKLHAEFRLLGKPTNGGIYLLSRYEVNIKDSYGQLSGDPCAALGNVAEPEIKNIPNAALPPFQWQTLDIEFKAPHFDSNGNKVQNAHITTYLNGIKLYENIEPIKLKGAATRLGEAESGPIMLQEHGTEYQFRNIWIVEY